MVTVLAKNVKSEQCLIKFSETTVEIAIELDSAAGQSWQLELDLYAKIIPSESKFVILSTKIEITLPKLESGVQWPSLEAKTSSSSQVSAHAYPSNRGPQNWDQKLAQEDIPLEMRSETDQFFLDLYANASDEEKKAMMKSYCESGGTVLDCNWDQAQSQTFIPKPPTGMQVHKWSDE